MFTSISKDTKKFIKEISLSFLTLFMIVASVDYAYRIKKPEDEDFTDKFINVSENIEICNFGSSHGLYGFNYEDLENEHICFNFALEAQYLSYDYKILKSYEDKLAKNAVVIIPVSFNSLFGKDETELDSFKSKNKRYYRFLSKDDIKEYDVNTDFYVNYLPSLSIDLQELLKVLTTNNTRIENWKKEMSKKEATEKAYSRAERQIGKEHRDENGSLIINETEIEALRDILRTCRELELNPIVITTPFIIDFINEVNNIDQSFLNEFHSIINKICYEYKVNYYDYSNDDRFTYEYSSFFDIDHLNKKGASVFTNIIFEEIIKYYDL